MDMVAVIAAIGGTGLVTGVGGTLLGHVLGRRLRGASITDLETTIATRLLTTMDERLQAVAAEADQLRAEVAELRKRLEDLDRDKARLLDDLAETRQQRDALTEQLATVNATLAARDDEIRHLTTLVAHGQSTANHTTT